MKVLWHVNLLPPEIEEEMGLMHCVGGSWLVGLRNALAQYGYLQTIDLHVISCYHGILDIVRYEKNDVKYYAIPIDLVPWGQEKLLAEIQPDLVHVHGTESPNGYAMAYTAPKEKVITSLQGIMFECAAHYFDGIPEKYKRLSWLKGILAKRFGSVLMQKQHQFFVDGQAAEEALLRASGSVIGRTKWDKKCAFAANAYAKYYACDEILRDCFYSGTWEYEKIQPHSLYMSQAHYPIKGAHMLFQAMGRVVKKYPDLQLYIGGWPPPVSSTKLRQIASDYLEEYRSYLRRISKQYGLEAHIHYIGPLSEEDVKEQLLKTHVFVSPSSIENESNALSEAKILGVPSIVSAVGGVQDRIAHGVDGYLYDFHEVDTLADYITELFADKEKCVSFSNAARSAAKKKNDIKTNVDTLVQIYTEVYAQL